MKKFFLSLFLLLYSTSAMAVADTIDTEEIGRALESLGTSAKEVYESGKQLQNSVQEVIQIGPLLANIFNLSVLVPSLNMERLGEEGIPPSSGATGMTSTLQTLAGKASGKANKPFEDKKKVEESLKKNFYLPEVQGGNALDLTSFGQGGGDSLATNKAQRMRDNSLGVWYQETLGYSLIFRKNSVDTLARNQDSTQISVDSKTTRDTGNARQSADMRMTRSMMDLSTAMAMQSVVRSLQSLDQASNSFQLNVGMDDLVGGGLGGALAGGGAVTSVLNKI